MKKICKNLSFIAIFIFTIVFNTNLASAFENPPSISWRAGKYWISCPTGKIDYVFEKASTEGLAMLNLKAYVLYTIVDSSYRSEITVEDINLVEKAVNDLALSSSLEVLTSKSLNKYISSFTNAATVYTTAKEIIDNLKNDTTDYELNLVLNRHVNLMSESKMANIAKYSYARIAIKELMDSGDITVIMSKPWESTLRAEVKRTEYAKLVMEKLREDLKIIESSVIAKEKKALRLNETDLKMVSGVTKQLKVTRNKVNLTSKDVIWTSSNKNVATVDSNGKVTTKGIGTATITVKIKNGPESAKCQITVKPAVPIIKLNKTSATIENGKTEKLKVTINPSDTKVTWKSNNPRIAKVDSNGNVKAVGIGTTTITVTTVGGRPQTAICKVTVKNPTVASVKLNKTSMTIVKGKIERLQATINPSNAINKNVTWTSSNRNVATVDSNGNVKAVAKGVSTITVTTKDGNKKATCKVTVNNPYKIRTVKFTVSLPTSFKQKHYVEVLDENNKVLCTSAARTGSSVYNFTYQLDKSSSSYSRRIRIRTVSGNRRYDSSLFKINSSTINKNVTATFSAGTSGKVTNSLKTGKITQK